MIDVITPRDFADTESITCHQPC